MTNTPVDISLVIPMMNEAGCLDDLFRRLQGVLDGLDYSHEIVCVNDGSDDDTLERLLAFQAADPRVRILDLSRNFGKEAALTAGLHHARGRCAIPIDADLQDPPELIADMLARWEEGFEVVNARRVARSADTRRKRVSAGAFYWLLNRISEISVPENVGDFRLLDRKVIDALKCLPERSRFNKGLFAWVGFRQTTIDYHRPERHAGDSKFRFWRLWNFAIDGITSFSSLPLRVWSYLGLTIALLAMSYAAYITIRTLVYGIDVPGYASTIVFILFFSGLNLLGLGIVGEYLSRVFIESKQRPLYIVRDVHEAPPPGEAADG